MDRIFYEIVQFDKRDKMIHIFGEIYRLNNGEGKGYRSAQFTGEFLDFEEVQKYGDELIEHIYQDGNQVYEDDLTEAEAQKCCNEYFDGEPGTEFDIYDCDQNTPCGEYWCEI